MLTVRRAGDADLDATEAIRARSWRVAYRGLVPNRFLDAIDPDAWAARRRARPDRPEQATFVAELDRAPVGMLWCGPYRTRPQVPDESTALATAEVYAVYVDPPHWGQGAGRVLMDAGLGWLRDRGTSLVRLWVLAGNARSRRFYERYGFVADGATHPYEVDGVSLPELRYTLAIARSGAPTSG